MTKVSSFKVSQVINGISLTQWNSSSLTNFIFQRTVVESIEGWDLGIGPNDVQMTSITNIVPTTIEWRSGRDNGVFQAGVIANYTIRYYEINPVRATTYHILVARLFLSVTNGTFSRYLDDLGVDLHNSIAFTSTSVVHIESAAYIYSNSVPPTGTATLPPPLLSSIPDKKFAISIVSSVGAAVVAITILVVACFYYRRKMRLKRRLLEWDMQKLEQTGIPTTMRQKVEQVKDRGNIPTRNGSDNVEPFIFYKPESYSNKQFQTNPLSDTCIQNTTQATSLGSL